MFLKQYFKGIILLVLSNLNKVDTMTKGTKQFSNPQALSSTLTALRTLQPRAFGLLNRLVHLVLASNYYLLCREHVLSNWGWCTSALLCVLCGVTRVHCVMRRVRLLVLVLSKSCTIGIWVVGYNVIQSGVEWGYVNTWQNAIFCMSMCFSRFASMPSLILLWQRMAVNLHVAHKKTDLHATHEVWPACFLLSCCMQSMAHMQCMKYSLCAPDRHAAHSMSHANFDWVTRQKLKNTRVFGTQKCRLRRELYCNMLHTNNSEQAHCILLY